MITSKWDKRFMDLAKHIATWSKDKSTGVGSVIVNDKKKILSVGFNGNPRGVRDDVEERSKRPIKDYYVVHSERNAMDEAETSLVDATIYCTFFTCATCAHGIIQKGIKKVVAPEPDWNAERYAESQRHAMEMYKEAGVEVQFYTEPSETLIAFWEIGCGGGRVHDIITADKFTSYIDKYKMKKIAQGIKITRYNINDKLGVIEFFVGKEKKLYLHFGNYEVNKFIFTR